MTGPSGPQVQALPDPDRLEAELLAFEPVPRKKPRRDGWTPERQRAFIAILAECGHVRTAANAVGQTPEGAYQLRKQPGAESFARAWSAALTLAEPPPPDPLPMTMQQIMVTLRNYRAWGSA